MSGDELPRNLSGPGPGSVEDSDEVLVPAAKRHSGRALWIVAGVAVTIGLLLVPAVFSGAFAGQPGGAGKATEAPGDSAFNDPDPVNTPGLAPLPPGAPVLGSQPLPPEPAAPSRATPHRAAPHRTTPRRPAVHRTAPRRTTTTTTRTAPRTAPRTAAQAPAPAPRPAPRPAPARFHAVGGEDCQHSETQGYYRVGTYSDGSAGWYRKNGGWASNGCRGTFMAMPMSGDASKDDPEAYAVWWFKTGSVSSGHCSVSVYVPNSGTSRDVAGHPAVYQVVRSKTDMRMVHQLGIDQTAHRGQWVRAGTYAISNGQFTMRVVNRGTDPNGQHIGVGQVQLSCVAA